jgi:hypothetical protein
MRQNNMYKSKPFYKVWFFEKKFFFNIQTSKQITNKNIGTWHSLVSKTSHLIVGCR